jgi:hypothetical protein
MPATSAGMTVERLNSDIGAGMTNERHSLSSSWPDLFRARRFNLRRSRTNSLQPAPSDHPDCGCRAASTRSDA